MTKKKYYNDEIICISNINSTGRHTLQIDTMKVSEAIIDNDEISISWKEVMIFMEEIFA